MWPPIRFLPPPIPAAVGGLVVLTADDPDMHSSQNEQDNRNYALAAKLPMLEPSDPAEAKEFLKLAFELSEASRYPGNAAHHHPDFPCQRCGEKGEVISPSAETWLLTSIPRNWSCCRRWPAGAGCYVEERMNRCGNG